MNVCRIHKIIAPKKEKQPLKPIKKSQDSNKTHSVFFEKFMSLYYEHFEVASSCSFSKYFQPLKTLKFSSSLNKDKGASSSYLPFVEDSFPTNPSSNDTNPLFFYLKSLCDLQEKVQNFGKKTRNGLLSQSLASESSPFFPNGKW